MRVLYFDPNLNKHEEISWGSNMNPRACGSQITYDQSYNFISKILQILSVKVILCFSIICMYDPYMDYTARNIATAIGLFSDPDCFRIIIYIFMIK